MVATPVQPSPSRERGRPREFDTGLALDNAMTVFREKGFHAASVSDLSRAMNLTAGSIYKAFTDKRTLFLNVFERYTSLRNAQLRQQIERVTTGRERIAQVLRFYLNNFVLIQLLTNGGPDMLGTTTPAGHTDLLVSYTYRIAFEGGGGQDFGLAAAIATLIFLLVGALAVVNLKASRMKFD